MNIHNDPTVEILKEEAVLGIHHNQLLFYIAIAILILVTLVGVLIIRVSENDSSHYLYPLLVLKVALGICMVGAIGLFFLDERPTGETLYTIHTTPDFQWENYKDNYILVDVDDSHTTWIIQDIREENNGEG